MLKETHFKFFIISEMAQNGLYQFQAVLEQFQAVLETKTFLKCSAFLCFLASQYNEALPTHMLICKYGSFLVLIEKDY